MELQGLQSKPEDKQKRKTIVGNYFLYLSMVAGRSFVFISVVNCFMRIKDSIIGILLCLVLSGHLL